MSKKMLISRFRLTLFLSLCYISLGCFSADWRYGISVYGDLKYTEKFQHFDYVNIDAPKGGTFKEATIGNFDSLNPYIVKGRAATGISNIYDTLLKAAKDEPFSLYGLIAEKVLVADDYSFVSFKINPKARFNDGTQISASDVKFSFELLINKGSPHYKSYYSGVNKVVVDKNLQITFHFNEKNNRELPLIIAQIPIFPAHFWQDKEFEKSDLVIPLGSGPYRIEKYDAGKQITYQRVENYWGQDLPVNRGMNNFNRLVFEYYRDDNVAFEAFKAGEIDFRIESSSKRWATGYKGEQFDSGNIIQATLTDKNPQGMQGFWYNLRKDKFQNPDIRQAIGLLFDFQWANKNLFYNSYIRIDSFFSGSLLSARGAAKGDELRLLEPYRNQLPDSVFTELKTAKKHKNGNIRLQMREAVALFEKAGYVLKDSKMQDSDGNQFSFEFLLYNKDFERVVQPFRRNLQRIGIKASMRLVDVSQYITRLNNFDFDIVSLRKGQSVFPGNEQLSFWGCASVMESGTSNWAGICHPAIDALIANIVEADTRQQLVTATRALDRVLLSQYIVIPQWYSAAYRIAYWKSFKKPNANPTYSIGLNTWWYVGDKADSQGRL